METSSLPSDLSLLTCSNCVSTIYFGSIYFGSVFVRGTLSYIYFFSVPDSGSRVIVSLQSPLSVLGFRSCNSRPPPRSLLTFLYWSTFFLRVLLHRKIFDPCLKIPPDQLTQRFMVNLYFILLHVYSTYKFLFPSYWHVQTGPFRYVRLIGQRFYEL